MNTSDLLLEEVETLGQLDKYLVQRQALHSSSGKELDWLVFKGTVLIDGKGRALKCSVNKASDPTWIPPKVLSVNSIKKEDDVCYSYAIRRYSLPSAYTQCVYCKEKWGLSNLDDYTTTHDMLDISVEDLVGKTYQDLKSFYKSNPSDMYVLVIDPSQNMADKVDPQKEVILWKWDAWHKGCLAKNKETAHLADFKTYVEKAGIYLVTYSVSGNIQDSGHPQCLFKTPWYDFKVGWRRRVMELVVLDTSEYMRMDQWIKTENTVGTNYVHACTGEELTEFLRIVHRNMRKYKID